MAETSLIEWTDATWNPITGCTLVSEGCRHCYAARLAATRMKHHPSRAGLARLNGAGEAKFTGEVRLNEDWLDQPLRWQKPRRIFVCAHGDLFHEAVPDEWIDRVFAVMALAPQHTFQVPTKRPERMRSYLGGNRFDDGHASERIGYGAMALIDEATGWNETKAAPWPVDHGVISSLLHGPTPNIPDVAWPRREVWPLPNVWLGTTAENQATADARIPHLLAAPAAVRFLSAEPLLGPLDLTRIETGYDDLITNALTGSLRDEAIARAVTFGGRLDWVIVGGESGRGARPMHPDWARSLRDQCVAAGVPFFFKQWGEWELSLDRDRDDPDWRCDYSNDYVDRGKSRWLSLAGGRGFHGDRFCVMRRVGKKAAGRELDGRTWDEMPRA